MRFNLGDPKKRVPSFTAKYQMYVFLLLSAAQLFSIVFSSLLLLTFYTYANPALLGAACVVLIAVSFYVSYSSVQGSQLVAYLSLLGMQLLLLFSAGPSLRLERWSVASNDLALGFAILDLAALAGVFYLNTHFPSYRPD